VTVHHFFVEPGDVDGGIVTLRDTEAHHAARVLRVKPGDRISVADGTGAVYDAVVRHAGAEVTAEVRCTRRAGTARPAIVLVQGIAKGDKVDTVVQKAVEVGVRRIVPVICERTIVRWDEQKREKAARRWREVARAAAKQCRSAWTTPVDDVRAGLDGIEAPAVALDPSASLRLRDALPADPPESLTLVVGPEGGLTAGELALVSSAGAVPATLGPRVLRTETAGPVAAALILYAYGSLG
jgi:16S rRNA (uracil1498-N3)-methyltransferase